MTSGGRRGLLLPSILVAVGVVALLVNAGLIPGQALARLADMWPLLLIVLGVDMVLRATLDPVRAGRLAIVTVAAACAVALVYASVGSSLVVGERTAAFTADIGSLEQAGLEMSFGGADVNVKYGSATDMGGVLYTAHVTYSGNQQPTASLDRSGGTVHLALNQQGLRFGGGEHRRADVTLNPRIPWAVSLSGGATQATLDLGGGAVRAIDVSGGAASVSITLPAPLAQITVSVSGGANSGRVHRPSGAAARAEASGGAGSLRFDGRSSSGIGDLWAQSDNYGSAADRYLVTVSGGANNVTVDTGS
ncbi:MAG: hypothetical protein QOK05_320 [Chloroflexota bacterium]|nr:hypothetical protein [Chloroflexota bacterium]